MTDTDGRDVAWSSLVLEQSRTRSSRSRDEKHLRWLEAVVDEQRAALRADAARIAEIAAVGAAVPHLQARIGELEAEHRAVLASDTWRRGRLVDRVRRAPRAVLHRLRPTAAAGVPELPAAPPDTVTSAYLRATGEGRPWSFPSAWPFGSTEPTDGSDWRRALREQGTGGAEAGPLLRAARAAAVQAEDFSSPALEALVEAEVAAVATAGLPGLGSADRRPSGARRLLVVDLRCLQDVDYLGRGVGKHADSVLRTLVANDAGRSEVVGLVDDEGGALPDGVAQLVARTVGHARQLRIDDVDGFVCLSPMTAHTGATAPFLVAPWVRCAAVVYDFVPYGYPWRYLPDEPSATAYEARLLALQGYDVLLPISRSVAVDCVELAGAQREAVVATGVADPLGDRSLGAPEQRPHRERRWAVAPTGADTRKDLPCAVAAFARSRAEGAPLDGLVVVGALPPGLREAAEAVAAECGLPAGAVSFRSGMPDAELADLYASAAVVLVPSMAEGFSLPVAEAVRRGTPVAASDIPPHRELLGTGPWLGRRRSPTDLAAAVLRVLDDPAGTVERQRAALGSMADPEAVVGRLTSVWRSLLEPVVAGGAGRPEQQRGRPRRPTIAVCTPWRPQVSGVSDFTARTVEALLAHADVTVHTEAEHPAPSAAAVEPLSVAPYLDPRVDVVLSVLGNSMLHLSILEMLRRLGGAALAHDARLFEVYLYSRGAERTVDLVSSPGHRLDSHELHRTLLDLDLLPRLGFDEVVPHGRPLVVHSVPLAERLQQETSRRPDVVPFVPYMVPEGRVDAERVRRVRATHGLGAGGGLVVASFGLVDVRTKRADLIVAASAWLAHWRVDHSLHFVGPVARQESAMLTELAAELGCTRPPVFHGHVERHVLEDMLVGVDVAVQLRSSLLGVSGALADCVAHGTPTVASAGVAVEVGAPEFVTRVPHDVTPILLAEAVESLAAPRPDTADRLEPLRTAYLAERNMDRYAAQLARVLSRGGVAG